MKQLKMAKPAESLNPISIIEELIDNNSWTGFKLSDCEIAFEYESNWGDFHLAFTWVKDNQTLGITCAIDQYHFPPKAQETFELLGLINQRLWLGHFETSDDGTPYFRYSLLLPETIQEDEARIIEDAMDIAISECERFNPVFQFHLAGKSPLESLNAAMLEPKGEA